MIIKNITNRLTMYERFETEVDKKPLPTSGEFISAPIIFRQTQISISCDGAGEQT